MSSKSVRIFNRLEKSQCLIRSAKNLGEILSHKQNVLFYGPLCTNLAVKLGERKVPCFISMNCICQLQILEFFTLFKPTTMLIFDWLKNKSNILSSHHWRNELKCI